MIVDDEPGVREGLAFVGELADMKVVEASNGKEAVEILSQSNHGVGVILSDRVMPEMNGTEFLKWVGDSRMNIPFIFITGLPSTEFTVHAFQLGAFDCLEKPFRIQHVSSVIESSQNYQHEFDRFSSLIKEESFFTAIRVEASLQGLSKASSKSQQEMIVELLGYFSESVKSIKNNTDGIIDLGFVFRGFHHLSSCYCHQNSTDRWPLGVFILQNLAYLRVHQQAGERLKLSLLEAISLAGRWVSQNEDITNETNTFLKQFAA